MNNGFIRHPHYRLGLFFVLFAATLMLAACGGGKNLRGGETPTAIDGMSGAGDRGATQGTRVRDLDVRGLEGIPQRDRAMFTDPNNPLSTRVIYFAFDSSAIPSRFSKVLEAHADYLSEQPDVKLRLEGHTDERGTREYNIALGERRAEAVEKILVLSGARSNQITTLSFGEERPAVQGSSDEAYAKNRRVELVYVK